MENTSDSFMPRPLLFCLKSGRSVCYSVPDNRLTKDPEVKYLQDENSTAMARYTLAVDRRYRKDGKAETDFISCVTGVVK